MRDLALIGLAVVVAIVLGTFLFFFGPASIKSDVNQALISSATPNGAVSFTVLAQGANAVSITSRTNYRIQNTNDLDALWAMVYGYNDTPAAPNVDFTKYEVLAVFDGSHPTNGYTINITSVTDDSSTRLVSVIHDAPRSSCQLKNTPTSPFEIVQVPITTLSLSHEDQTGTSTCP